MKERPTQKQLENTIYFLEWYKSYIERTEPYATNTLEGIETILNGLPDEMNELNDLTEKE